MFSESDISINIVHILLGVALIFVASYTKELKVKSSYVIALGAVLVLAHSFVAYLKQRKPKVVVVSPTEAANQRRRVRFARR